MKIIDLRWTHVAVPLEAPLRSAEAAEKARRGGGGRRPADPSRPNGFPTYPAY